MKELEIASNLSLGLDSVTKTFAILAQRRKGKTYTASVVAEELVEAGQPWVALDPTGAWWGLRAGADGSTKGGLPVYVFGGQHGDLPLERTAGKVIADLVVDEPCFYVLDLSAFESKEAERQFATDFAERLYRRKAKKPDPLHLFVDEADVFVPQRIPKGDPRMVGAFEAIVRRGGIRGIGTTLISQRAAVVNKNVLEQIDVLIVLRVVGPNDQKAIRAYIEAHGSDEERAELMGSLASLKLGEAWIWEPGSEPPLFQRAQIRERRTYNSSATPKAGEPKAASVQLADIDLDALRGQIEATVEKAKAEDPKELQRRIRELERELKQRPTEPIEVEKVVEVPVLADGAADALLQAIASVKGAVEPIEAELQRISTSKAPSPRPARSRQATAGGSSRERGAGGGGAEATVPPPAQPNEGERREPKGLQVQLLARLAAFQRPLSALQLGMLVGKRASGGYFRNMLGGLRSDGWVAGSNEAIVLTPAGAEWVDRNIGTQSPPTSEDVIRMWEESFSGLARELFRFIVHAYPESVSVEDLGEWTGKESTGGYFRNMLGSLRSSKAVVNDGPGHVRASEELFL